MYKLSSSPVWTRLFSYPPLVARRQCCVKISFWRQKCAIVCVSIVQPRNSSIVSVWQPRPNVHVQPFQQMETPKQNGVTRRTTLTTRLSLLLNGRFLHLCLNQQGPESDVVVTCWAALFWSILTWDVDLTIFNNRSTKDDAFSMFGRAWFAFQVKVVVRWKRTCWNDLLQREQPNKQKKKQNKDIFDLIWWTKVAHEDGGDWRLRGRSWPLLVR